jgi:hypothetical protein
MLAPATGEDAQTHTRLIAPGIDIKLGMPYPEVRALVEKLIKEQYEYSIKWHQYSNNQRKQDLDEMIDKLKGGFHV